MRLLYTIKFLDYWHMSSGLSAGAKLDSSVLKDRENIPYIPGKTIKGLVKEMGELLEDQAFITQCFGTEGIQNGACYFSNAVLAEETRKEIIENGLQHYLYDELASTKIDQTSGVAEDKSLREIEVVVPLTLLGEVADIPDSYGEQMQKSIAMVKRMGLNRNRGLGRCEISMEVKA